MPKYDILDYIEQYLTSVWDTIDEIQGMVYCSKDIPLNDRDEISLQLYDVKNHASIVRNNIIDKYFN